MFCLYTSSKLPSIIWIFTEGEGDGIESRLPFKIFSTLPLKVVKTSCGNVVALEQDDFPGRILPYCICIFQLSNLSYFCLVCLEKIRPKNATWHCDGECFQVFHIHCIKKWSKTTRTNEGWRCPGKFKYMLQFLL